VSVRVLGRVLGQAKKPELKGKSQNGNGLMTEREFLFTQNVAGLIWLILVVCTIGSVAAFPVIAKSKIRLLKWWAPAFFPLFGLSWFFLYLEGWESPFPPFWKAALLGLFQGLAVVVSAWIFDSGSKRIKSRSWVQACVAILVYFPLTCFVCAFIYTWWIEPPFRMLQPLPVYPASRLSGGCSNISSKSVLFWNVYEADASLGQVTQWYKANSRRGRLSLQEGRRSKSEINFEVLLDGLSYNSLTILKSNAKKRIEIYVPTDESKKFDYSTPCDYY
jgi:hypothetical protein